MLRPDSAVTVSGPGQWPERSWPSWQSDDRRSWISRRCHQCGFAPANTNGSTLKPSPMRRRLSGPSLRAIPQASMRCFSRLKAALTRRRGCGLSYDGQLRNRAARHGANRPENTDSVLRHFVVQRLGYDRSVTIVLVCGQHSVAGGPQMDGFHLKGFAGRRRL